MRAAPPLRLLVAVLVLVVPAALLGGCGKSQTPGGESSGTLSSLIAAQSVAGVATSNTTRLRGADPVTDAAAVAGTAYPGLTSAGRPQAVVLVDAHNWPAALAASGLASAPLGAPLLYAEGDVLPAATVQALRAMRPLGAPALGGAQVIRIATSAAVPEGLRTRDVLGAGDPSTVAGGVEQVSALARHSAPREVIVLAADAAPALLMPAAGLSAESGAPILFVTAAGVPAATAATLKGLARPAIYLLGPSAISSSARAALARLGPVTPIAETGTPGERAGAVENAIAVARFTDGRFGWGVKEPGHGLVFANAARPLDAPAGALLSASGDYGPLLLLEGPSRVPPALAHYLADIQPAYGYAPQFQPVHGAYNHGWLIGDESAISAVAQDEIDSMLEIVPRKVSSEEAARQPSEELSAPTVE
jgi:hypothetical protein